MVITGSEGERVSELKTMGPERSKPLHNFAMPSLKWGNQRFLRCMKVNSNGEVAADDGRSSDLVRGRRESESEKRRSLTCSESLEESPTRSSPIGGKGKGDEIDGDDGIEAVRAKLMFDLQAAADKMKVAIFKDGEEEDSSRPWNLRTRRAACKAPSPSGGGGKSLTIERRKPGTSPSRTDVSAPRRGEKKERAKFSVSLSRQEIEEDFMAITGHRPARRPKKRAKNVQKQLDTLFPGLWLTEVTPDSYKVPDFPETGKLKMSTMAVSGCPSFGA
ncbi:hypothetical protein CK203_088473 [Vitis vinifera]|uniref:DUF1639 domain-containing protein n=1 Tax=Vitis vinifera TaxID=29760 RepID=A0A438ELN3_VITVI|nr:hypothetical protein CK203_088473 [Vitis vinifera]